MRGAARRLFLVAVPLALVVSISSVAYGFFEKEAIVKWSDVPMIVRNTVRINAHLGKVEKVERETRSGKTIYEFEVTTFDNRGLKVKVREDGRMTGFKYGKKSEEEVAWEKVPKNAQKTISANAAEGKIKRVEREIRDGMAVYEAKIKSPDAGVIELKVNANGELLDLEAENDGF